MKQTKHSRSQRLKIYVQNVHHSREHMHSNDYTTAQWSSSLHSLSRRSFVMDPRAVDPLLRHTPDAVVHLIQIWRIRWPNLWRAKLWHLSAAW